MLLNFFTVLLIIKKIIIISSTSAPKNKSKPEPCLVSLVVVLMRGCSGTGEYEAGRENQSIHTTKKLDYTTAAT